jgi:hypothetical protein
MLMKGIVYLFSSVFLISICQCKVAVDRPSGNRTYLCRRANDVLDGLIPIQYGLENITIRVAVANTERMFVDNATGNYKEYSTINLEYFIILITLLTFLYSTAYRMQYVTGIPTGGFMTEILNELQLRAKFNISYEYVKGGCNNVLVHNQGLIFIHFRKLSLITGSIFLPELLPIIMFFRSII